MRENERAHYSEADLLETYYTQPGDSIPVMMHLADCRECASRYERLESKIRGLAACEHDKPETFWARQRISVMRRIDAQRNRTSSAARVTRVAAAVVLALTLGGVVTMRVVDSPNPQVAPIAKQTVATLPAAEVASVEESPWDSEELSDLHSMVAWESWIESAGDHSL